MADIKLKTKESFINDLGRQPIIYDPVNKRYLPKLPRYAVFIHNKQKDSYDVVDSGDDLQALLNKHKLTETNVKGKGLNKKFNRKLSYHEICENKS